MKEASLNRHGFYRSLIVGQVLAIAVLTGCGAQGSNVEVAAPTTIPPSVTSGAPSRGGPVTLREVARLDDQHAIPPFALAADPSGGVFFWSRSAESTDLYHVTPEGKLNQRQVLLGADNAVPMAPGGLAATKEAVWLAINQQLLRITDSAVQKIDIPSPRTNKSEAQHRPVQAFPVRGLAASDSLVVLALENSADLVLYDPRAGSFQSVALPESAGARDVAVLADGTIGVALTDYSGPSSTRFGVLPPGEGALRIADVKDSTQVLATADSFIVGVGSDQPTIVDRAAGTVSATRLPARKTLDLGDGRALWWDSTTVKVAHLDGSDAATMDVPLLPVDCSRISDPGGGIRGRRGDLTPAPCPHNSVTQAVGDSQGNVWLTFGAQPAQIFVVSQS